MSRIVERPQALLDGASRAGQLLDINSDAFRYVQECGIFPVKFSALLDDVPALAEPEAIRLAGSVGSPRVKGQSLMAIPGESYQPHTAPANLEDFLARKRQSLDHSLTEEISYGFDVIPDLNESDEPYESSMLEEMATKYGLVKSNEQRLLRISRIVGRTDEHSNVHVLGLVGIDMSANPQFYNADILDNPAGGSIKSPAAKSELIQIIAAGIDAVEWAFD